PFAAPAGNGLESRWVPIPLVNYVRSGCPMEVLAYDWKGMKRHAEAVAYALNYEIEHLVKLAGGGDYFASADQSVDIPATKIVLANRDEDFGMRFWVDDGAQSREPRILVDCLFGVGHDRPGQPRPRIRC